MATNSNLPPFGIVLDDEAYMYAAKMIGATTEGQIESRDAVPSTSGYDFPADLDMEFLKSLEITADLMGVDEPSIFGQRPCLDLVEATDIQGSRMDETSLMDENNTMNIDPEIPVPFEVSHSARTHQMAPEISFKIISSSFQSKIPIQSSDALLISSNAKRSNQVLREVKGRQKRIPKITNAKKARVKDFPGMMTLRGTGAMIRDPRKPRVTKNDKKYNVPKPPLCITEINSDLVADLQRQATLSKQNSCSKKTKACYHCSRSNISCVRDPVKPSGFCIPCRSRKRFQGPDWDRFCVRTCLADRYHLCTIHLPSGELEYYPLIFLIYKAIHRPVMRTAELEGSNVPLFHPIASELRQFLNLYCSITKSQPVRHKFLVGDALAKRDMTGSGFGQFKLLLIPQIIETLQIIRVETNPLTQQTSIVLDFKSTNMIISKFWRNQVHPWVMLELFLAICFLSPIINLMLLPSPLPVSPRRNIKRLHLRLFHLIWNNVVVLKTALQDAKIGLELPMQMIARVASDRHTIGESHRHVINHLTKIPRISDSFDFKEMTSENQPPVASEEYTRLKHHIECFYHNKSS